MAILLVLLPMLPAVAAALVGAVGWRGAAPWLGPVACAGVAGLGAALAVQVVDEGPVGALGGHLRADALSALMVILIGVVGAVTSTYSVAYLRTELDAETTTLRRARLYGVLMQVTLAAMVVVVLADNLGVLWVAIETTTVATVLLVGHRRDRASLEASW